MLRFPVKGRTLADLKKLSEPQPVRGGVSEAIAWAFHDTELYTTAVTTHLDFFVNTKANRQLCNLTPAGSLPEPQYFEVYGFMVDMLVVPSTISAWADHALLLWGTGAEGPPVFSFTLSDKNYGPFGLTLLHGTGGITGFGLGPAAAAVEEYANNSVPDGGMFQDGAIMIPPSQGFSAKIEWAGAVATTVDTLIKVTMAGVLHRRVL